MHSCEHMDQSVSLEVDCHELATYNNHGWDFSPIVLQYMFHFYLSARRCFIPVFQYGRFTSPLSRFHSRIKCNMLTLSRNNQNTLFEKHFLIKNGSHFFLSSWYNSSVSFQVFHTFPSKSSSLYVHSVQLEVEDYRLREVRDLISVLHCFNSLNCQKNT